MPATKNCSYGAGLQFVVNVPGKDIDPHLRKEIRSHARRGAVKSSRPGSKSTMRLCHHLDAVRSTRHLSPAKPSRFGSDFSGLQLPKGVEPCMIQEFVKLIRLDQHGIYPYEIVFHVHVTERGWFPYMVSDICCVETLLFSTRYFSTLDNLSTTRQDASVHHIRALQLLQARLDDSDSSLAISDTTIIAITMLAAVAEVIGDLAQLGLHLKGLIIVVKLRGGVAALDQHKNIQVKVCKFNKRVRIDLAYALLSGTEPLLLGNNISWECLLADRCLLKRLPNTCNDSELRNFFIDKIGTRLRNVHKDLYTFSCLSNLAYQTTRKLSPELYNEIMISVLYRLLHLRFDNDSIQEALRTGFLVMCSTIFLQPAFVQKPYHRLIADFNSALYKLNDAEELPLRLAFWLAVLAHVTADCELPQDDWRSVWLRKLILAGDISSWPTAQKILRSIFWVDFVHEKRGKIVFSQATQ